MILSKDAEDLLFKTSRRLAVISVALEGLYARLDKREEGEANPIFSAFLEVIEQVRLVTATLIDTAYESDRP